MLCVNSYFRYTCAKRVIITREFLSPSLHSGGKLRPCANHPLRTRVSKITIYTQHLLFLILCKCRNINDSLISIRMEKYKPYVFFTFAYICLRSRTFASVCVRCSTSCASKLSAPISSLCTLKRSAAFSATSRLSRSSMGSSGELSSTRSQTPSVTFCDSFSLTVQRAYNSTPVVV